MADASVLLTYILESGISLIGDLVRDTSVDNKYYAFVKAARDSSGAQSPTNFRLRGISQVVQGLGGDLVFVLVQDDQQDILANTKAMLIRQFPEQIRNVFPTFGPSGVVVWIEPRGGLSAHDLDLMKTTAREFLKFLKVSLEGVHVTSSENLPTRTVCLKSIRYLAPTNQAQIRADLEARDFYIPSDEWLSHALDKLRKANLIVRAKSGHYSLSLLGLNALGSGKGRASPDVARALAIAKRGA